MKRGSSTLGAVVMGGREDWQEASRVRRLMVRMIPTV
jgi:hypothetical protein